MASRIRAGHNSDKLFTNEIETDVISGPQFERIARRLVRASGKGRIAPRAFAEAAPTIAAQLSRDAASPLLDFWGRSSNFDELARDVIVHPKLLTVIGRLARTKIRDGSAYHAGLIHTYGYLFSWLKTRYGYKRERWLRPTIEAGLGLPPRTLRAEPRAGTLLQNATWCFGQIALRDCPQWRRLDAQQTDIPAALRDYPFAQLDVARITERVSLATSDSRRTVELRTDLVTLPGGTRRSAERILIVYSAKDARHGGAKLISAFTSDTAAAEALCRPEDLGRRQPIRPRFNCSIEGFPAGTLLGTRRLAPAR